MRPKEIQEKLGIDAERIKLFKRDGIFKPEHPPVGNKATDYTETDFKNLQRIVVLTKAGLTCADIRKLQIGEVNLEQAIRERKQYINDELERKRNALKMLDNILDDSAEFEAFQTQHYWDFISEKEADGEEFIDIEDMQYGYRSVSMERAVKCPHCGHEENVDLEDFMYDESSYEKENGMGPDLVYSFNSEDCYECPECGNTLKIEGWIREYPMGAYDSEDIKVEDCGGMKMTSEERELLKRMDAGEFDGIVGNMFQTDGGSTVWITIKDGIPTRFKQGPGGKFFNGKENERYEGVLHTLKKWVTDEERLDFLRKLGWLIHDVAVNAYSEKFKPKK